MGSQIHWHEGQFLQPHHLQAFQYEVFDQFGVERRMNWSYPYGTIEAELSADALENMIIQFSTLRAVMPSGRYIEAGVNADLSALDIKRAFQGSSGSLTVSLGVPIWYRGRPNTVDASAPGAGLAKRIFQVNQVEMEDENTGENPQPVPMRRINARLLLDGDDHGDMEVLPVVRIARAVGEDVGMPRQDPEFIPPCLVTRGSPTLLNLVRDLASQVEASREELVLQMSRAGFRLENMRGIGFEQVLRLRSLSSYGARLNAMVVAPCVAPFALYLELQGLLGELSGLYPNADERAVPSYAHDNVAPAFIALSTRIRGFLRGAVKPSYVKVPFTPESDYFVAPLTDEQVTAANEYYIGVKTAEDPKSLIALFEDGDRFKVMATSMVTRAIRGVKLEAERVPPLELPSQTGLHYFRMNVSESVRMWERIRQEKRVAVCWSESAMADYQMSLFMTVPATEG